MNHMAQPNFSPRQTTTSARVSPPTPAAQPTRRPRRTIHSVNKAPENLLGLITSDEKFLCAKKECSHSSFSRLADLKRHYEQSHGRNRAQFWCPYPGCHRSHAPGGGSGRHFGTRKDKRDEHVRNVHEKKGERLSQYSPTADL